MFYAVEGYRWIGQLLADLPGETVGFLVIVDVPESGIPAGSGSTAGAATGQRAVESVRQPEELKRRGTT